MKMIIAATDFTPISVNAVDYAAGLAVLLEAELSLIHVSPMPLSFSEVPLPGYTVEELVAEAEKRIKELKEQVIEHTAGKISVVTTVKYGDVMQEIQEFCESQQPYAIVMGAETMSAFERLLAGGKTLSALQAFSLPLIVVPREVRFKDIRKIGLACDYRELEETLPINQLKTLVRTFNAELHVLHVFADPDDALNNRMRRESSFLKEAMEDLHPEYHFLYGDDIEQKIVEFGDSMSLDLLVVIPKKHNFINKLFKHSHSKKLVLHAHVPVMAIHE